MVLALLSPAGPHSGHCVQAMGTVGAELLGAKTWVLVLPQAVGSVLSPCPAPSTARITWAATLKPARVSPRCLSPELLTHSVPLINYLPPGGFSTFLNKYASGRAGRSRARLGPASPLGVAAAGAGSVLGGGRGFVLAAVGTGQGAGALLPPPGGCGGC